MKYNFLASFLLFLLIVTFSSCSSISAPQQSTPEVEFKMVILKEKWSDLDLGYEAEKAQTILGSIDINNPLFVITKEKIEKYDWDLQTITLTSEATQELVESLSNIEENSGEIERLYNLKNSLEWGNLVESSLYIRSFIVQVDSQFKYGGIFLSTISAMAINFPVARITISDGKIVIALLPIHIPSLMIDPVDANGNLRPAFSADEAKFRTLIRDENIRNIFENDHP